MAIINRHLNFKGDGEEDTISKVEIGVNRIMEAKVKAHQAGKTLKVIMVGVSLNLNLNRIMAKGGEAKVKVVLKDNKMMVGEVLWEILAEDGEINIQESIGSIISSRIKVIK